MFKSFVLILFAIHGTLSAVDVVLPKGGITVSSLEDLVEQGNELGRPKVILYYSPDSTCPLHNGQVKQWMQEQAMSRYVVFPLDADKDGLILHEILAKKKISNSGFIPRLYFINDAGEYVDGIPYKTDAKVAAETIVKYGGNDQVLSPEDAQAVKVLLANIEKSVTDKSFDDGRRDVKKVQSIVVKLKNSSLNSAVETSVARYVEAVVADAQAIADPALKKKRVQFLKSFYKGVIPAEVLNGLEG